jgi:hypothetical protein
MSNRTYVCFPCRTAARAHALITAPTCRKCGLKKTFISYKTEIPKATDDKGWKLLKEATAAINAKSRNDQVVALKRKRSVLFMKMNATDVRNGKRIKDLNDEIEKINTRITDLFG